MTKVLTLRHHNARFDAPHAQQRLNRSYSGSPHSVTPPLLHRSLATASPNNPCNDGGRRFHVYDEVSFWTCLRRFHGKSTRPYPNLSTSRRHRAVRCKLYEFYQAG